MHPQFLTINDGYEILYQKCHTEIDLTERDNRKREGHDEVILFRLFCLMSGNNNFLELKNENKNLDFICTITSKRSGNIF